MINSKLGMVKWKQSGKGDFFQKKILDYSLMEFFILSQTVVFLAFNRYLVATYGLFNFFKMADQLQPKQKILKFYFPQRVVKWKQKSEGRFFSKKIWDFIICFQGLLYKIFYLYDFV